MKKRFVKTLLATAAVTALCVPSVFAAAKSETVVTDVGPTDCVVVVDTTKDISNGGSVPDGAFNYSVTMPTDILLVSDDAPTETAEYHGSADIKVDGVFSAGKTLSISATSLDSSDAANKISLTAENNHKIGGDFNFTVNDESSDAMKAARTDSLISLSTTDQRTEVMNESNDFGISIHDVTGAGFGVYEGGLQFNVALQ